jgi:hypothetical protein
MARVNLLKRTAWEVIWNDPIIQTTSICINYHICLINVPTVDKRLNTTAVHSKNWKVLYTKVLCHSGCCKNLWQCFILTERCLIRNSMKLSTFEKLIVSQLFKRFSAIFGTRMFINLFTRVRRWIVFWTRSVQSTPSHLRLCLPNGVFPWILSTKILYAYLISLMPCPYHTV